MKEKKIGVVHGRFQPYHLGHLKYTEIVYNLVDKLIIGITNPDPNYIKFDPDEPKRHLAKHNPFTYYERYLMIKSTLLEFGFDINKVDIVPFPINIPDIIKYYIPISAVHYIVNYEKWSAKKASILKQLGYRVVLLPPHDMINISGYDIKKLIAEGGNWKQYVPDPVYKLITNLGLDKKVKKIWEEDQSEI